MHIFMNIFGNRSIAVMIICQVPIKIVIPVVGTHCHGKYSPCFKRYTPSTFGDNFVIFWNKTKSNQEMHCT